MLARVEAVMPHLPADRPHYLMGVGTPEDLLEAIARGVDMFDCVLPTRNGRHGLAFTRHGPINLKNARHAEDPRPLDAASRCPAARAPAPQRRACPRLPPPRADQSQECAPRRGPAPARCREPLPGGARLLAR